MVVRLLCDSLIWAQKPKSAKEGCQLLAILIVSLSRHVEINILNLMLPSRESRMLSDLISRWITPFECRCCKPFNT